MLVLVFFKSCLNVDVHGLIMIAVSTTFFSPATHAGMEEYILDLCMVIYMELNECEEKKNLEKASWDMDKRKEGEDLDQKRGAEYRGLHC